jgi:hypothetical protein
VAERHSKGYFAALAALVLFVALAALPWLRHDKQTPPFVQAISADAGASRAPTELPPVSLTNVSRPVNVDGPQAALPNNDAVRQSALVNQEDVRLRTIAHRAGKLTRPTLVILPNNLATWVLPKSPQPYDAADLVKLGAFIPISGVKGYTLSESLVLAPGASLKLGGSDLSTVRMTIGTTGFTSIVAFDGATIDFSGVSAAQPLNVIGWDQTTQSPAQDRGSGRPYIRAIGSKMTFDYVTASSLGFWSGRTGGVAWTGTNDSFSTGGASNSRFAGGDYGAFLSRTDGVRFTHDLFESNEHDCFGQRVSSKRWQRFRCRPGNIGNIARQQSVGEQWRQRLPVGRSSAG